MLFKTPTTPTVIPSFSIITIHDGSAGKEDLIFCNVASLADQGGVTSEQILHHAGGVTGLWSKLSRELSLSKRAPKYTLRLFEEKNSNRSDTLHSALKRTSGTFIGLLSPEDQYLPGALAAVEKEFKEHPEVDLIVGGVIHCDPLTQQKSTHPAVPLSLEYLWTSAPQIFSSSLFFRSSLLGEDVELNLEDRSMALSEWFLRFIQSGKKIHYLNQCTTFLTTAAPTSSEKKVWKTAPPAFMSFLRPWWQWRHQQALRKAQQVMLREVDHSIYELSCLTERR